MSAGRALINARDLLQAVHVRPGQCVADFGCGRSGHLIFPASWAVGDSGKVYAVDVSKVVLDQVMGHAPHARATNVHPVLGDVEHMSGSGLADASVDHVFCVNNLWCLHDYPALLQEMRRVVKPDGFGYLVDWHKETRHPVAPQRTDRARMDHVLWLLSEEGIEAKPFYVSPYHWGLALKFL